DAATVAGVFVAEFSAEVIFFSHDDRQGKIQKERCADEVDPGGVVDDHHAGQHHQIADVERIAAVGEEAFLHEAIGVDFLILAAAFDVGVANHGNPQDLPTEGECDAGENDGAIPARLATKLS